MSTNIETLLEEVNHKAKMKSYRDSFLYNQSGKSGEDLMKKHDKLIIDFIMKAERIDKKDPRFYGIAEDVKRQQTTSILYTILMLDNVYLCSSTTELPPAFKVIDARDIKSHDNKPAIFIDVTKLIVEKNGLYVCKNIGKLVAYLLSALIYLSYRKDVNKIVNNSAITISGCECYTAMFLYVIDYLRIIGFSVNKPKIGYFAALFYLTNMLGKELDTYTKNLAAKIAGIPSGSVNAFDLYMEDGMFDSIDIFVTKIAEIFKLKGLTIEVFVQKWIFLYGNGSQYGCELFTSFATILAYTYTGAYIVNQKQIDKCCGTSMFKFCNSIMMVGSELFDRRMYMGEAELANMKARDYNTQALAESVRFSQTGEKKPEELKFVKEDFSSTDSIEKKITDNIDHYTKMFDGQEKLETVFETAIKMALVAMDATCGGDNSFLYENGVLTMLISNAGKYMSPKMKASLESVMNSKQESYLECMRSYRDDDLEKSKRYSKSLTELRECTNIIR